MAETTVTSDVTSFMSALSFLTNLLITSLSYSFGRGKTGDLGSNSSSIRFIMLLVLCDTIVWSLIVRMASESVGS